MTATEAAKRDSYSCPKNTQLKFSRPWSLWKVVALIVVGLLYAPSFCLARAVQTQWRGVAAASKSLIQVWQYVKEEK